eukprot:5192860-Prymnesium_polylepis.1
MDPPTAHGHAPCQEATSRTPRQAPTTPFGASPSRAAGPLSGRAVAAIARPRHNRQRGRPRLRRHHVTAATHELCGRLGRCGRATVGGRGATGGRAAATAAPPDAVARPTGGRRAVSAARRPPPCAA